MAQAVICPICEGKGKILDEATKLLTCPTFNPCHGCGGKGWVEVGQVKPDYSCPMDTPNPIPFVFYHLFAPSTYWTYTSG